MVRLDKEYVFEGPDGQVTLADLFGDQRQLIVQHVMFGPDWEQPCPGCTACINAFHPVVLDQLGTRETAFVFASRAPSTTPTRPTPAAPKPPSAPTSSST